MKNIESGSEKFDIYDWSPEQLGMPLLFTDRYIDPEPNDGSGPIVKCAARWDKKNKQVIVATMNGDYAVMDGYDDTPDAEEVERIFAYVKSKYFEYHLGILENVAAENPFGIQKND